MTCPICSNAHATVKERDLIYRVDCQRCGMFTITREARDDWNSHHLKTQSERGLANISGWIREHQNISIRSDDLDFLKNLIPPRIKERADKLLLAFEKRTQEIGKAIPVPSNMPEAFDFISPTWSINIQEVYYLTEKYLIEGKRYLEKINTPPKGYAITPLGFSYLDELRQIQPNSMLGFCAMWFKTDLLPIWVDAIEPAIKDAGYDPKRIDRVEHNNRIDDEIIAMIRRSKFVVADFTGHRGGVYFEAGFAMGLSIPVIWTVNLDDLVEVHFDNRQYNFITWQMDNLADFKNRLQNRIEATIGKGSLT